METIGERICGLRKKFRLTQSRLAENFHFSDKVISKWETNESQPNTEEVAALSQFFGVTSDYLIFGKETDRDKEILSRQPSEEELTADAKSDFIKRCNALIRNNNLNKYKAEIFPDELCKKFLSTDFEYVCIGIFQPLVDKSTQPYGIGINLKALLTFDDYNLFEKIIALNLPFSDKNKIIRFFKSNSLLSDKDVHGLTDIRFYSFLADQTVLIKQSYERPPLEKGQCSFEEFWKQNENDYKSEYKKILSETLRNLERTMPNYWEIVKILIEKGAVLKKAVNVHYGEYGDMSLHMDYADDLIVTELFYELACAKTSK